ncbi:hypothetical protein ACSNOK_17820 [Streptomyces sp. URMC 126]|uniref:hypothetical protein n=1 Tax=Streptomyces sp. URMC 126 TaxID=3423401 RepID=UPI003F1A4EEF
MTGRRARGQGERLLLSLALVAVSLLWMTRPLATWALAACWVGTAVGVLGTLWFGWRYFASRGAAR